MGWFSDLGDYLFGGGLEDDLRSLGREFDRSIWEPFYDWQKDTVNYILDEPLLALSVFLMPTQAAWMIPLARESDRYQAIKDLEREYNVDIDYDWRDGLENIIKGATTAALTGKISNYLNQFDLTPEFLGDGTLYEGIFQDGLSAASASLIVGDSAFEGFKKGLAGQTTAELSSIAMGELSDLFSFNVKKPDGTLKTMPRVVQNTLNSAMNAQLQGKDITGEQVFGAEIAKLAVTQQAVRGVLENIADLDIRYSINNVDQGALFDKITDGSEQSDKALSFLTSSINNVVGTALAGGSSKAAADQLLNNINDFGVAEMSTLIENSIIGDTLDAALDILTPDFNALQNSMESFATFLTDNKETIDTANAAVEEVKELEKQALSEQEKVQLEMNLATAINDLSTQKYEDGKFIVHYPEPMHHSVYYSGASLGRNHADAYKDDIKAFDMSDRSPQIYQIIKETEADFTNKYLNLGYSESEVENLKNYYTPANYYYPDFRGDNTRTFAGYPRDGTYSLLGNTATHDGYVYTIRLAEDAGKYYSLATNYFNDEQTKSSTSLDTDYLNLIGKSNEELNNLTNGLYSIFPEPGADFSYGGIGLEVEELPYSDLVSTSNNEFLDADYLHRPNNIYTGAELASMYDDTNEFSSFDNVFNAHSYAVFLLQEDFFRGYYNSNYNSEFHIGEKNARSGGNIISSDIQNIAQEATEAFINNVQRSLGNVSNYTSGRVGEYNNFVDTVDARLLEINNNVDFTWQDAYDSAIEDINLANNAMIDGTNLFYSTFASDFNAINTTIAKAMDPLFNAQDYYDMYGDFDNNFTLDTAAQHYVALGSKRNAFTNNATRDMAVNSGKYEFINGATYYSADSSNIIMPPIVEGARTLFGEGVTVADVVSANAVKTYSSEENAYIWEKRDTTNLSMWDPQNGTKVVSDGYTIIEERELDFQGYSNTLDELEALDSDAVNEIIVYATRRDSDTASLPFTSYIPSIDWQMRAEAEAQRERDRLAHEAKLQEIADSDLSETEKQNLTARQVQAYTLLEAAGGATDSDSQVIQFLLTLGTVPSTIFGEGSFGRDLDYAALNATANIVRAVNGIKTSIRNSRIKSEAYQFGVTNEEIDYETVGLDPKYGAYSLLLEEFADARSSEELKASIQAFDTYIREYENDPELTNLQNATAKYGGAIKNAPRAFLFDSVATEVFETMPALVVGGVTLKAGQGFKALASVNMGKVAATSAYATDVLQAMGNTYESSYQRIYTESENQLKNLTETKFNVITGEFYEAPKYTVEEIDDISKKHADAGAIRAEMTQLVVSLATYKLGAAEAEKVMFGEVVNNKTFRETFNEIARVTAGEGVAEFTEESAVQYVESLYVFNNINSNINVDQEVADSGVYGLFTGASTAGSMTTAKGLGQHAYNYTSNSQMNVDLNGFTKFFTNDPLTNILLLNPLVAQETINIRNNLNSGIISTEQADQAANDFFGAIGLDETAFVGKPDDIKNSMAAVRSNLLNAINDDSYHSTDEVSNYFQSFGYTAAPSEIYQFTGEATVEQPLYDQIATYVEPLIITVDDVIARAETLGAPISNEEARSFAGQFTEENKDTALSNRDDRIRSVPKFANADEFKNYLVTEKGWAQEQADTYYDANKAALDSGIQTLSKSYIEQEFGSTFDKAVLTEEEVAESIRRTYPNLANETTENLRTTYPGFFDQVTLPTDEIDTNNLKVEGKDIVESMSLPEAETITESEVRASLAESLGVAVADLNPVYDSFITSAVDRGKDVILTKNQSTQEILNDITTIQNRFTQSDYAYTDQDVANLLGQAGVVGDGDVDSYLESRQYTYEDAKTDFMNALRIKYDNLSAFKRATYRGQGLGRTGGVDPFADTAIIDQRQGANYLLPDDIAFIESLVGLNTTDVVGRDRLLDSIEGYLQEQYTKAENALKAAGVINPVESDVLNYVRNENIDTGLTLSGAQIAAMSERGVDAAVAEEVTEQIGRPAREVTQEDIDRVTAIVTPESDTYISPVADMGYTPDFGTDIMYDVNNDGVVDSNDLTILQQIQNPTVYGQPTDLSTDSVFADTGVYANIDTDTQTDTITDAITDINTRINTEIAEREKAEKEAEQVRRLQQLAAERQVRVTTPDAAEIDYTYDFESVFATPEQQQQYEGALPYKVAAARGGLINNQTDELLAMLEALDK